MVKAELDFAQYYANSNYLRYGALADGFTRKIALGFSNAGPFFHCCFYIALSRPDSKM